MAEASELPPRDRGILSTLKHIACGESRCVAGREVCALGDDKQWHCQAPPTNAQGYYACDDISDCVGSRICCRSFASAHEVYECSEPRGDCAAVSCAAPDGLKCPAGQHCSDGHCAPRTSATCGSRLRCEGETPICAWGTAPSCVTVERAEALANTLEMPGGVVVEGAGSAVRGVYACTKPSDCGSFHCCTSMSFGPKLTLCSHRCDSLNGQQVCQTNRDCADRARAYCGDNLECRRKVRCVPARDDDMFSAVPPWLKVCELTD
ncbi:MAG: hypothetical protein SFV15_11195 [Polyangiaceae bacterium]|nr:hypothetical protein [Polyangiaceae bacterium]